MAPSFFSKLVKTSSNRDGARSPSPSPTSPPNSPPRHPTISISRPSTHRASESIDALAAATARDTDSESINPNVTVIPPSPRTSDMSISDGTHTPPTGRSSEDLRSVKKKPSRRVHSLSLGSSAAAPLSPNNDDDAVTPTPSRPTMSARDRETTLRPLSHSSSTGDLRAEAANHQHQHPRSATVATGFEAQQELHRTPSLKSNKSAKSNRSGLRLKLRGDKSEKTSSRPSTPNKRGAKSPPRSDAPSTPGEEGSVTMSPIVESPTGISPSNALQDVGPSRHALNASATLPNVMPNGLLSAHDNSDAASVYSTSSTTKKNRLFRRLSMKEPTSPALPSGSSGGSSKSPKRKNTGLAGALAASGLAMANPLVSMSQLTPAEIIAREERMSSASGNVNGHRSRSSVDYARSPARSRQTSLSYPASDLSDRDSFVSGVGGGSDEDSDLDLDADDIPVTGFAVASARRNQEFHEMFPSVPEGDYLIDDYGCAMQREILVQGRLYVSENHVCFHANIFGWVTNLTIPMYDVISLDKRMTAFVIPNAIQLTTRGAKYTFTSFLSRDTTFDVIYNVWRLARPEDSSIGSNLPSARESLEGASGEGVAGINGKVKSKNKVTTCACSKQGEHYSEIAMEVVLPGTPEKIYNLMFTSGFIKDFMRDDQKLTDIQISDWEPLPDNPTKLTRNMSYIKPLNGSIGPKSTRCEIRDETAYCDFEEYVSMLTATRTPEVPSGNVFVVKTRTCIMWASSVSTRIIVTSQVEWTGRSFIKGIIERSAIDGQKTYHAELEKAMRDYITKHQSEFVPEGMTPAEVIAAEQTALDSPKPEEGNQLTPEAASKKREKERNQRGLQWAYDTLEGAAGVAKRSTTGAIELLRDAWDQSSTSTIQYLVIVLLVLSNVWTLLMVGTREETGRRKELRRVEEKEKWIQGVVSTLWDEIHAAKAAQGGASQIPLHIGSHAGEDIKSEVAELNSVLDKIEERVQTLRKSLQDLD